MLTILRLFVISGFYAVITATYGCATYERPAGNDDVGETISNICQAHGQSFECLLDMSVCYVCSDPKLDAPKKDICITHDVINKCMNENIFDSHF